MIIWDGNRSEDDHGFEAQTALTAVYAWWVFVIVVAFLGRG